MEHGQRQDPATYKDTFIETVGVEALLAHFKTALKTWKGSNLTLEMHILIDLIYFGQDRDSPLMPHLVECNFYKEVLKTTQKQLKDADDKDKIVNDILAKSSIILL